MNGVSYREQLAGGAVMAGYGICEVLTEGNERLPAGTLVLGEPGWQEYAALPARTLRRLQLRSSITDHLGALGPTGLTAYFGLLEIGRPQAGETVVPQGSGTPCGGGTRRRPPSRGR